MPVICVQLTTALRFSYFRAISSRRFKGQLLLVFVPVMWHICLARASRQMIKELIFMPWLFQWSTKSTATCKRAKGKIKKRTPTSCIHDIFFPLLPCRDTLEFHYKINAAKCTSGRRKELQITTCLWLFSSVWHGLLLIKSPNMHFKSKDLHYRLKSAVSNIGFQKDLCFWCIILSQNSETNTAICLALKALIGIIKICFAFNVQADFQFVQRNCLKPSCQKVPYLSVWYFKSFIIIH